MSRFIYFYAECHYADCHHAEWCYADCHHAEWRYAEWCYAECHYTDCRGAPRDGLHPYVLTAAVTLAYYTKA